MRKRRKISLSKPASWSDVDKKLGKTFGWERKRYYFCNPKRRGSDDAGTRNDEMGEGNEVERGLRSLRIMEPR